MTDSLPLLAPVPLALVLMAAVMTGLWFVQRRAHDAGLVDVGWTYGVGVMVWLAAITGEAVADRQLAVHRADPANRGRTCRRGLWRWSRHPNYFFEWLHRWSYAIVAIGSPLWWIAVAAPLVMGVYLFVTGIPPIEARAVASRGDDYREHQRTTSASLPWPPGDPPAILRAVPGPRYSGGP